jgi:hypothetical protein
MLSGSWCTRVTPNAGRKYAAITAFKLTEKLALNQAVLLVKVVL